MAECFRPDYFKTLDEGLPSGGRLKPDGIYFDFDSTLDAFRVFIANREGTGAFPMVIPALDNEPLTIGEGLLGGSYDGSAPITISANFGTGSGQIARGNHNHDGVYRPVSWTPTLDAVLAAGNTSDKSVNLNGYGTRAFYFYDMNVYNGGHLGIMDGYPELKLGSVTLRYENSAVEISGGHLRTLNGDPSDANDLTRKAYVDAQVSAVSGNRWGSDRIRATSVTTADLNTSLPDGGYLFSYSTSSWATNGPSWGSYGGWLKFQGYTGDAAGLELFYNVGHGGGNTDRIGYRAYYGTKTYNSWREIWTDKHFSSASITNWNTAVTWGNHANLYPLRAVLGGNSNSVRSLDTRAVNPLPTTDLKSGVWFDFKQSSTISLTGASTYAATVTMAPYADDSGNNQTAFRLAQSGGNMFFQTYTAGAWLAWNSLWSAPQKLVITSPSTGQLVQYNGTNWVNVTYAGQASITTLGTITTGTWNGTAIAANKGGTGLTALGTAGQLLRVNAGATALEYFTPAYLTAVPTLQQVLTAGDTATGKDISLISVAGVGDLAVLDSVDNNIRAVLGAGYLALNGSFLIQGYTNYAQLGSGQQIRATSDPVHIDDLTRKAYVDAGLALKYNIPPGTTAQYVRGDGSLAAFPSIPSVTPAALTRTSDTNVVLTLGGTPNTALLQAVSITASWTGTLSVDRGGSGAATLTGILVGNGASAFTGVAGTANQLLRRNAANTAYEFFTPTYLTANQAITLSGDVTGSGTTAITATIANSVITDSKLRNSGALSVIGRSANSTGAVADISAATDGHVLRRSGTTLGFGTIGDASISGLDWGKLTGLPSTFAPSPHTLDSHSNVTIISPSLNQYLGYNGSGWVNMTLPAGTVQNLSWSAGTGELSISGGTGANLDGRYFRIIRGHASNIDAVTSAGQGYWNPTTTDANSVLPGGYGMWVNFTALAENPGSGDWGIQFLIPSDSNRIRIRRLSAPSTWGVTSDLLTGHTGIATVNGIQQANGNHTGLDANTINPASVLHVEPVSNGPNSLTAGILQTFGGVERRYQFFTGPQGDNHYYRSRLTAAGGYGSWYQAASRAWVTTTLGSYATTASLSGYVNTNTNQTGIAGWKGWAGNHTWIPESDNNATNNAIMFGLSSGNGPNIIARNADSIAFILRSYAISGIQLTLMKGGVSASAAAYASGGYGYLVRNATSGNFETRAIGIGDVTGLQAALDGKGAGTVTSVNITPPTGFTAGAAVTTSGNITLSYAAGYSLPTTAKQTAWDTSAARWFSINAPTGNDLNNATQGGVLYWSNTTANAPASTYGTVFTFVGASSTGDGAASNTWINQILASTGNDWYIRQSINNWSTWSTTYKIWTEKQFTSTSVSQWNTAYGWGAHTGLYVPLARTVSAGTGLSGGGALNSNQTISFNTTWGDARYSQVGHSHATLNPGTGISGNGYNGSSTQTWSISFGTSAGQAAQGNDSRINNGQTAFGWGNHAGAGYVNSSRSFTGVNSIEGGGDFSTNRNFWLAGDVGSPGGNKYYGTNGGGSKGWWDLPSVSGYVPTNRIVSGAVSIQGGGDLNTNRYLQLVGDTTTPGPNRYYGTNGSETKGWWALPSTGVGGSGTNGYIPLWNSGSTLTNSVMVQSGGTIHINGPLNVSSSDAFIGNNLTVYGKAEVANGIFVGAHSTSSMNALSANDGSICYNTTISELCVKRSGTWYRLTRGAAI